MKKILLSFVGTNDAGKLIGPKDGAILTALNNERYDKVILLWNDAKIGEITYSEVVQYLSQEIVKKKVKVEDHCFEITDVTDHNIIYKVLKDYTDKLEDKKSISYTAAISSGTPAMQVCWILLAESGDFSVSNPLKLIKVKDPKFGTSQNIPVKLSTSLPRIIGLKNQIESLKADLIPSAIINVNHGMLKIGDIDVDLSPIEFCYYRYFAKRVLDKYEAEKFSGITVPLKFMELIYHYHQESFPDLDLNREDLRKMIKNKNELGIQTFRGNISKVNKKIKEALNNITLIEQFQISITGKRGAKFYGVKCDVSKIKII